MRSQTAEIRDCESIEMDIVDHGSQIIAPHDPSARAGSRIFDRDRLITSPIKMPPEMTSGVEAAGKGILEPLHPRDQIRLGSAEERVVMVVHEHPGENFPPGAAADFSKSVVEKLAVPIVKDDGLAVVPTGHDVVDGVLVFDSRSAVHGGACKTGGGLSRNVA